MGPIQGTVEYRVPQKAAKHEPKRVSKEATLTTVTAEYEQILVSRTGSDENVTLITLNRPEKLNAWTHRMRLELMDAIDRANGDPAIGAIVLTGAGRAFCAGADIEETFNSRLDSDNGGGGQEAKERPDWVRLIRDSKPTIAAINGVAVGVGITQVLPCDVLLGSTAARIGMFFVKMGVVPELASSQLLVQRIGFARASEMCLTGALYDAQQLQSWGFFNDVVEPDALLPRAVELAEVIAANAPASLRWTKQLLTRNACEPDLAKVQEREIAALEQAYQSAEHKEAVAAFIEKRKPDFRAL